MSTKPLQGCCTGLLFILLLLPALAQAAPEGDPVSPPPAATELKPVEVSGEASFARDRKTLGQLLQAEKDFERLKALAPNAELRFKVLERKDAEEAERNQLQLLTPQGKLPVPQDALHRFSIDHAWRTLPTNTEIRSKLADGHTTWRPDVRTPGLPGNTRRLGDLRLQCKLTWGSGLGRGPASLAFAFVPTDALCKSAATLSRTSFLADAPVFTVTLVHGERREQLSYFHLHGSGDAAGGGAVALATDWGYQLRDHLVRLPLEDESWPDEALVVFEYMDDPAAEAESQPASKEKQP